MNSLVWKTPLRRFHHGKQLCFFYKNHMSPAQRFNGKRLFLGTKTVQDSSRFTVAVKTVLFDSFITAWHSFFSAFGVAAGSWRWLCSERLRKLDLLNLMVSSSVHSEKMVQPLVALAPHVKDLASSSDIKNLLWHDVSCTRLLVVFFLTWVLLHCREGPEEFEWNFRSTIHLPVGACIWQFPVASAWTFNWWPCCLWRRFAVSFGLDYKAKVEQHQTSLSSVDSAATQVAKKNQRPVGVILSRSMLVIRLWLRKNYTGDYRSNI